MNLDTVIAQLRTNAALFSNRVAGAAQFAKALDDQVWMTLPAAYVIPLEDDSPQNLDMNDLQQVVTERIGVVIEFDNSIDRRGQGGSDQVEAAKYAVFAALLNWRPDATRSARGLYYGGGKLLSFDRARLFWQFEFCLDATIVAADGFQDTGVALVEISGKLDINGDGVIDATFAVGLPQPVTTESGAVIATDPDGDGDLLTDYPTPSYSP